MRWSVYRFVIATIAFATFITACGAAPAPTPTPLPSTAILEPTPSPVLVEKGRNAFLTNGCGACHALKDLSEALAAPPHDDLYDLAQQIIASPEYQAAGGKAKTVREYILESILDPNLYVYSRCPQGACLKDTMPMNYKDNIKPDEMEALMTFLMTLRKK